jgi:hypothetical protein
MADRIEKRFDEHAFSLWAIEVVGEAPKRTSKRKSLGAR